MIVVVCRFLLAESQHWTKITRILLGQSTTSANRAGKTRETLAVR